MLASPLPSPGDTPWSLPPSAWAWGREGDWRGLCSPWNKPFHPRSALPSLSLQHVQWRRAASEGPPSPAPPAPAPQAAPVWTGDGRTSPTAAPVAHRVEFWRGQGVATANPRFCGPRFNKPDLMVRMPSLCAMCGH